MYKVKDVLSWIDIKSNNETEVSDIVEDIKKVKKNAIFIARRGNKHNGNQFVKEAIRNGACLILSDQRINNTIYVEDFYAKISKILNKFYEVDDVEVVGITGTNGKSTTAYILFQLYNMLGERTLLITTTNGISDSIKTDLTTPINCDLAKIIYEAKNLGYKRVVMECSSIGIACHRLDFLKLKYLVINKITSDHLDFHSTKKNYRKTKLNFALDNPQNVFSFFRYKELKKSEKATIFDSKISNFKSDLNSCRFRYKGTDFSLNLPFKYNAYNALICYNSLVYFGYDAFTLKSLLKKINPLPGRMEKVDDENIYIDYAHTYPALKSLLKEVSGINKNIIIVIGAGGERDKTKRKMYGKLVAKYCQHVILTDDNPRNEDEESILEMMKVKKSFVIIKDRSEAIRTAVLIYKKCSNSVLLIVGKGDENYQVIKGITYPFSDREEVKKCLDL